MKAIDRCLELAKISESSYGTLRTFLSEAMRSCYELVGGWMREAGMSVSVDSAGNLRGVFAGTGTKTLLMGSHLDTVENAGAFDGILGVIIALELVEGLNGRRLPFNIEVIGFSEEEGVRFGVPFIGSRGFVGTLDDELLNRKDAAGISVADAIRAYGFSQDAKQNQPFAFFEFHIEQGPVLDSANEAVGIVDAIAGQSRVSVKFIGAANHAGTTPMSLRRDTLACAAEWILAVEERAKSSSGLVATVGRIQAVPGLSNVISGETTVSLDVRHASDQARENAVLELRNQAAAIAKKRNLSMNWTEQLDQPATSLDEQVIAILQAAALKEGITARKMTSGAGHDAMILAPTIPSAMLFVRSPGGISHDPAETVRAEDVAVALRIGRNVIDYLEGSLKI
jgi:allantoate deiminase